MYYMCMEGETGKKWYYEQKKLKMALELIKTEFRQLFQV